MTLTLEALRILDAIDRRRSFAGAAAELDKVPSALTYTVRKLEDELDVLLFDRRGHRARLTPAGEELLSEGRNLLRAADELERRVKRAASGCEVELRIVLDSMIPFECLLPLLAEFDAAGYGTRLRFSQEVLSGVWEALLTGRADLAIGAAHDGPEAVRMSGGFRTRNLTPIEWVFAVAPGHPLAAETEPLPASLIQQHRAVAVGDTSRTLPLMNAGLLSGQDTLTVPSVQAKLAAQLAGLGCGHLPRRLAQPYLADGRLVAKATVETRGVSQRQIAWRADARGKSLKWFLNRLGDAHLQEAMLGG
ncbi:DNA-binding transcriptional regulator, LysR family [Noviherbaspirillum humi]|uniref:DNA-binding transcriptional regulator, LysR family n=1 Tax=Noviherbaspirillum humi TaxID=1688639 RepID=A0A239E5X4_9BURK|nr:LysR family transcriptional regulator [Noviherbaspirillum humi]SNS40037.1 DNA-binding transcriptional regulator, LysR family [Noviherbaspirillum humi]